MVIGGQQGLVQHPWLGCCCSHSGCALFDYEVSGVEGFQLFGDVGIFSEEGDYSIRDYHLGDVYILEDAHDHLVDGCGDGFIAYSVAGSSSSSAGVAAVVSPSYSASASGHLYIVIGSSSD